MRWLSRAIAFVVPPLHRWLVRRPPAEPVEDAEDRENVYPLW
jgi:hypothetical protein